MFLNERLEGRGREDAQGAPHQVAEAALLRRGGDLLGTHQGGGVRR